MKNNVKYSFQWYFPIRQKLFTIKVRPLIMINKLCVFVFHAIYEVFGRWYMGIKFHMEQVSTEFCGYFLAVLAISCLYMATCMYQEIDKCSGRRTVPGFA